MQQTSRTTILIQMLENPNRLELTTFSRAFDDFDSSQSFVLARALLPLVISGNARNNRISSLADAFANSVLKNEFPIFPRSLL